MFIVNATRNAYVDMPAQMVRLRLLNGSLMRSFNVGLSNGDSFWVIASDGGLLESPVQMNRLLIANAERYEILVDLSLLQGSSVDLMNYGSGIPSGVYGTATIGGMGGASIPDYDNNPLNGTDFTMLTINVVSPTELQSTRTIKIMLMKTEQYKCRQLIWAQVVILMVLFNSMGLHLI